MTDLGTVTQVDDGWELRFERRLPHPVEKVWEAITDPDLLLTWWGKVEASDLRPGGRFVLAWQNEGGPTMTATITAYDPPRLLETDGDVHGRIRWELEPDGDGTRLVFLNTLAEAPSGEHLGMQIGFPENLAGWHWHLAALEASLDGHPWAITDMTAWEGFRDRYAAASDA